MSPNTYLGSSNAAYPGVEAILNPGTSSAGCLNEGNRLRHGTTTQPPTATTGVLSVRAQFLPRPNKMAPSPHNRLTTVRMATLTQPTFKVLLRVHPSAQECSTGARQTLAKEPRRKVVPPSTAPTSTTTSTLNMDWTSS